MSGSTCRMDGFTLVELIATVVLVAILATIAIPSYQSYVRRAIVADVQQEMLSVSILLEQHKARNFNYKGFDIVDFQMAENTPNAYQIRIVDLDAAVSLSSDAASGRHWAMLAIPKNPENEQILLNSLGHRCKSKTSIVDYQHCDGTDAEAW
ncbi:MAG: type IV pilin protein [Acinetobacter sp.]